MTERIIGQALYEMHCAANSELVYTWNDLPPYDRMVYVEVAIVLSGTYLAPLQGLVEQLRADFQRLKVMDGDIQEEQDAELSVMRRENDALKALLLRHKGFIEQTPFMSQEEWLAKTFELFSDTVTLLNGEQKEG